MKPRVLHSPPIGRNLVRGSTGEQELTLDHQAKRCQEYAEGRGWVVDRIYEEAGVSARKRTWDEREQIIQALRDAENGDFDYLIVWSGDRLARDPGEQELLNTLFKRYGVEVCYADPKAPKADRGIMTDILNSLMAHFARIEVDTLIRRVRAVIRLKAERGEWVGGTAPYGYRYDKTTRKVEVVDTEIQVVRDVYRWAADENLGGLKIARRLNNGGQRRRNGGLWTTVAIQRMLRNKFYCGYLVVNIADSDDPTQVQVVETKSPLIPAAVTEDIWLACQHNRRLMAEKQLPSRHYSTQRLFAGLIYCNCGARMSARCHTRRWTRKDGTVTVQRTDEYICRQAREGTGECTFVSSYKSHVLEPVLCQAIAERLTCVDPMALQEQMRKNSVGDNRHLLDQIGSRKHQVAILDGRIRKAVNTLAEEEDADIKQHLRQRVRELREEREAEVHGVQILERRLAEPEAKSQEIEGLADRLANWPVIFAGSDDCRLKRRMILDVVDRVLLSPDRTAHIRLKIDPTEGQDGVSRPVAESTANLGSHDTSRVPKGRNENLIRVPIEDRRQGVHSVAAETTALIKTERSRGTTLQAIAEQLNERAIPSPRRKRWSMYNVGKILKQISQ